MFTKAEKRAMFWLRLVDWSMKDGQPVKYWWNDFVLTRLEKTGVEPADLMKKLGII